jgi:guanylate kinase
MPQEELKEAPVEKRTQQGLAVVISAPSGAGKTSILFMFLKRHPEVVFSVSITTRPPRAGEKEGLNYHFVSPAEFESLRDRGELLEWNQVHGNWYGTLRKPFREAIEGGKTVIFDTDPIGALNIRKAFPEAVLVFIVPRSPDVLRDRLARRNTETPEHIEQRLAAYPAEIARMAEYDYIIINDDLKVAVTQFSAIIDAEQLKSGRVIDTLDQWRSYYHGRIKSP